jgi:hypothetical protein
MKSYDTGASHKYATYTGVSIASVRMFGVSPNFYDALQRHHGITHEMIDNAVRLYRTGDKENAELAMQTCGDAIIQTVQSFLSK